MRFAATLLIGTMLAMPALVQASAQTNTATSKPHHRAVGHTGRPGHPTATDQGPFTADADKAYMGGGAILEGQPGGPPPPASAVSSLPPNAPLPPSRR